MSTNNIIEALDKISGAGSSSDNIVEAIGKMQEGIGNAVDEYLRENPPGDIVAGVSSVNGKQGEVTLNANDVGAISTSDLQDAIDDALTQAKESGEFDGATGATGSAGHSPVVTATKSGKVTTVSVDGTAIATINDGNDGSTGAQGPQGPKGDTPVKGTDYWTSVDKAEIVADVTDELVDKITEPSSDGTAGQVLTTDGEGGRSWESVEGVSDGIKLAMLQIARNVAYSNANGASYYDDLMNALYPQVTLEGISATYTPTKYIYVTDSLDSLKDDLVVEGEYSNNMTIPVPYTLSGSLARGSSTITATYGEETDTFSVTVREWRYLTLEDIIESTGFTGLSVSNGVITATSYLDYTVLEFSQKALPIRIRMATDTFGVCYNKVDANSYYGFTNAGGHYTFTKSVDHYTAVSTPAVGEMIVNGYMKNFVTINLIDGELIITGANNSTIKYTNANCVAVWFNATDSLPLECEVSEHGII